MAKKKRRIIEQPEEEYEFTPTEFNEREFILKDIYMTKIFLVVMVLGVIIGVVGAVITDLFDMGWVVATLIAFAVCIGLNKILALVPGSRYLHPVHQRAVPPLNGALSFSEGLR